jgi:hypothetical protein
MSYEVVIVQDGETARLACASYEEAVQVRQSFINYGKYQSVEIERKDPTVDRVFV